MAGNGYDWGALAQAIDPSWTTPPPVAAARGTHDAPAPVPESPFARTWAPIPAEASAGPTAAPEPAPASATPAPGPNVGAAPTGPPGPPPGAGGNEFPLVQIGGGGVVPAHEVETRGPSVLAAQGRANEAASGMVGRVGERSQATADQEYGAYVDQARQAQLRQAAAEQSGAERDQELQQRQSDFDQSVKALSKMSLDPNRFWASRNTGEKISGVIGIALGGFVAGARGGSNQALDIINQNIERDLRAQEFAYGAAKDATNAKATAFGQAMQKYGSVDAARAAARAAALDSAQAQIAQQAALWKGTDAANRADAMMADIEQQKMQQVQQGIRFMPATAAGPKFVDPRTGITYDMNQARELSQHVGDQEQARQMVGLNAAKDITVESAKAQATGQDKTRERTVVVDGKEVSAKSKDAADKWDHYTIARSAFADALRSLKDAREAGDPGRYDAARAKLIETYPELLGYTRAPTTNQTKVTVGPEAIPEYNHWYSGGNIPTLGATYVMHQGRAAQKIDELDKTLASSDKAMRESTFLKGEGSKAPTPKGLTFHGGGK